MNKYCDDLCRFRIDNIESVPKIHELLLVGLGNLNKRPIMFARTGEDLVIYEAYPYYEDAYEDILKIRFVKVKHHLILREKRYMIIFCKALLSVGYITFGLNTYF